MFRRSQRLTLPLVALLLTALLGGCASSGPSGPPPEEQIQNTVMDVLAKLGEGDIDTVMAAYADDFTWDQGDKAAMSTFLQGAADAGFLDGMTSNTENMEIVVDGDTAKVSGLSIEGAFGLLDLTFDLANRDGVWKITKQVQE